MNWPEVIALALLLTFALVLYVLASQNNNNDPEGVVLSDEEHQRIFDAVQAGRVLLAKLLADAAPDCKNPLRVQAEKTNQMLAVAEQDLASVEIESN